MFRHCALAALLLVAAPLGAAEPAATDDKASTPWYNRIVGDNKPTPPPKPAAVAQPRTFTRHEVATSLEQEQRTYMERLQFCTRLRQIAVQTNDEDLFRKADDLEQQASDVYMKKTSKLPALLDSAKTAEIKLEERRATSPTGTASSSRTFNGRAPNGRPITTQE